MKKKKKWSRERTGMLLPSVPMNLLGKQNIFKGCINHLFIMLLP